MSEGDGNGKECLARSSLDSCLFCPLASAHCPTMMHSTLIRSALLQCLIHCSFRQPFAVLVLMVYGAVLRHLPAPWHFQCFDAVVCCCALSHSLVLYTLYGVNVAPWHCQCFDAVVSCLLALSHSLVLSWCCMVWVWVAGTGNVLMLLCLALL